MLESVKKVKYYLSSSICILSSHLIKCLLLIKTQIISFKLYIWNSQAFVSLLMSYINTVLKIISIGYCYIVEK